MKNFSQILTETYRGSEAVLKSEVSKYIAKVKGALPKAIKDILFLTDKYDLMDKESLENIRTASKAQMKNIADQYHITPEQAEELHDMLKGSAKLLRLLPQYQSEVERQSLEAGQLALSDLTIDLETSAGRNAAAKLYMPLVFKIAAQYIGKSKLDKPALISAGQIGLADAMNDWKREGVDGKKTTFKTYASYRIQQAILNEINEFGHDLSGTNWYASEKYGAAALDAISIDGFGNGDNDDDFSQDRMLALGEDPTDPDKHVEKEEEEWKDLFKVMEKTFSERDMDIFYRYWGLGPYHGNRQKSKDIAKAYGMSEGNIQNGVMKKIIKFLQTNSQAKVLLDKLREMYECAIAIEMFGQPKEVIREAFYEDNIYMLFEEATRWNNKSVLQNNVYAACDKLDIEDAKFIFDCFEQGINFFNKELRKNKKLVVFFLSEMYPTENMSRKPDAQLSDYMSEIIEAGKMLKIDW